MRVISKSRLKRFWEGPGHDDAEGPLRAWHSVVNSRRVAWRSWSDVKSTYGNASIVGNCIVFNIAGNKYRLATRVLFPSQKVFILKVMTHADYSKNRWQAECGCYSPPPGKPRSEAQKGK